MQKADRQPVSGTIPDYFALDGTVIQIDGQCHH